MALLLLFNAWSRHAKAPLPVALIVDHRLRQNSSREAAEVARRAKSLGFTAKVLRSDEAPPKANIEEVARARRYGLLGAWCVKHRLKYLFVAHTMDDQAETFLLRLGRGSGVDGLSGMKAVSSFPFPGFSGVALVRPLLGFRRTELRDYLNANGVTFINDPMNADPRFARTRIRAFLPALEAAGIATPRIAAAARHLERAREALELKSDQFLTACARIVPGENALLDGAALLRVPREIGLRVLRRSLMLVGEKPVIPRFESLEPLFDALANRDFRPRTLHGCRIGRARRAEAVFGEATLVIARENPRRLLASKTEKA
jgi:tRNA(Ile)-lysidine synthase